MSHAGAKFAGHSNLNASITSTVFDAEVSHT
jgi:hypothetical protein